MTNRPETVVVMLLGNGPCTFNDLWLGTRLYVNLGADDESRIKVADAIRAQIDAKKIAATVVDGAIVYHLPLSAPMEKKSEPGEKTANQVWRDAERAHR